MKTLVRVAIAVAVLLVVWLGAGFYASNSGEVVTLTTTDTSGATPRETPLWIVDRDGAAWLRAGSDQSAWVARIRANPRVAIQRGGTAATYRAMLVPEATPEINALMAQKYGFADRLVGWLLPGSRGHSLAVRLDPE